MNLCSQTKYNGNPLEKTLCSGQIRLFRTPHVLARLDSAGLGTSAVNTLHPDKKQQQQIVPNYLGNMFHFWSFFHNKGPLLISYSNVFIMKQQNQAMLGFCQQSWLDVGETRKEGQLSENTSTKETSRHRDSVISYKGAEPKNVPLSGLLHRQVSRNRNTCGKKKAPGPKMHHRMPLRQETVVICYSKTGTLW